MKISEEIHFVNGHDSIIGHVSHVILYLLIVNLEPVHCILLYPCVVTAKAMEMSDFLGGESKLLVSTVFESLQIISTRFLAQRPPRPPTATTNMISLYIYLLPVLLCLSVYCFNYLSVFTSMFIYL